MTTGLAQQIIEQEQLIGTILIFYVLGGGTKKDWFKKWYLSINLIIIVAWNGEVSKVFYNILLEKPGEAGGAPLGSRLKEGVTYIGRAIIY